MGCCLESGGAASLGCRRRWGVKGHCHGDSGVAGEVGPHRERKGRETGPEGRGSLPLQDVGWEGGVQRREWRGSGRRSRLKEHSTQHKSLLIIHEYLKRIKHSSIVLPLPPTALSLGTPPGNSPPIGGTEPDGLPAVPPLAPPPLGSVNHNQWTLNEGSS